MDRSNLSNERMWARLLRTFNFLEGQNFMARNDARFEKSFIRVCGFVELNIISPF